MECWEEEEGDGGEGLVIFCIMEWNGKDGKVAPLLLDCCMLQWN